MEAINHILESQKMLETTFNKKFIELDAALQAVSPLAHPTIASLNKEVAGFKAQMSAMLHLLRQEILSVSNAVDAMEMRHRRKFLIFDGVAEAEDQDIVESIITVCSHNLKLPDVTRDSISVCHRLGTRADGRPRSVLVRFADQELKSTIWKKKTALKGSKVVISEFLTKQRRAVFIAARNHFGMRNVWSLDGNIYIKTADGKKERITTADQLDILSSQHAPVSTGKPAPAAKPVSTSTQAVMPVTPTTSTQAAKPVTTPTLAVMPVTTTTSTQAAKPVTNTTSTQAAKPVTTSTQAVKSVTTTTQAATGAPTSSSASAPVTAPAPAPPKSGKGEKAGASKRQNRAT